jgi:hypothetical protein
MNWLRLMPLLAAVSACSSAPADDVASAGDALITTTVGGALRPGIITPILLQPIAPRVLIGVLGVDGLVSCTDLVARNGRWVALRVGRVGTNLAGPAPDNALSSFCVLEWTANPGTNAVPDSAVLPPAVVANVARYADAPIVAPSGAWLDASAARLRDAALVAANRGSTPLGRVPAYVGVVDSSPDDFTSCEVPAGRYDHAESIGRFVRVTSGSAGLPCGNGIATHSALGLPRDASGAKNSAGGSYGYVSDLAAATLRTLAAWTALPDVNAAPPNAAMAWAVPPPRVLNLSLGWDDANASLGQNARDLMRAVLKAASCRGVAVIAAAGNGTGATAERMLAPAAWQNSDAAPTASECTALGFPRPARMAAPGASSRLVYAVGAVDAADALVFNARVAGTPRLVAYGDAVAMPRVAGRGAAFTEPKTGTSMGAALASAVVAAAWTHAPTQEPGALIDAIYRASVKLATPSKSIAATACGPFSSGCQVARLEYGTAMAVTSGVASAGRPAFGGKRAQVFAPSSTIAWSVASVRASSAGAALRDTTATAPSVRPMPGSGGCSLCGISGSRGYLELSYPVASATLNLTSSSSATTSYPLTLGAGTMYSFSLPMIFDYSAATITFTGTSSAGAWSATDTMLRF